MLCYVYYPNNKHYNIYLRTHHGVIHGILTSTLAEQPAFRTRARSARHEREARDTHGEGKEKNVSRATRSRPKTRLSAPNNACNAGYGGVTKWLLPFRTTRLLLVALSYEP